MSRLLNIMKREIYRIGQRKTIYGLLIFMPIALALIFGFIFKNSLVTNVPVAIFDEDKSTVAQTIIKFIESSSSMKITHYVKSTDEIKRLFRQGKIDGAFYIPKNLEKSIKSNNQSNISLFVNSSNLIKNNYVLNDGLKIIKTVSAGVTLKKVKSMGLNNEQALNIINPIRLDTQVLYNPNYSYSDFLYPSLVTFTLLMTIFLVSALLISSEVTHNTFSELVSLSNKNPLIILFGKAIPHIFLAILNSIITLGLFFTIFNISIYGSLLYLILLFILFLSTTIFIGIMISSLFHNQMLCVEITLFFVTPAFIFSGLTFPLWAMPKIHQLFAEIIPYTHFTSAFLKISMMNAPFVYWIKEIAILFTFLSLSIIVTIVKLSYDIKRIAK